MLRKLITYSRVPFICCVKEGLDDETRTAYRAACKGLSFYAEREGTQYRVLHYPSQDKDMDKFGRIVEKKLNKCNFDFRGVWFPSTWKGSSSYEFDGKVDFSGTTFKCADFQGATFNRDAVFTGAAFCATCDEKKHTDFRRATFKEEAYFREVHFTGYTDFYRAHFLGAVRFIGAENKTNEELRVLFPAAGQVSFNRALIDKPELFSFDTIKLRSSWFVGVDARKFRFTHVQSYGLPGGLKGCIDNEIYLLTNGKCGPRVGTPHSLLEQTCRELHINCEESREYPLANEFHYWSMEAPR